MFGLLPRTIFENSERISLPQGEHGPSRGHMRRSQPALSDHLLPRWCLLVRTLALIHHPFADQQQGLSTAFGRRSLSDSNSSRTASALFGRRQWTTLVNAPDIWLALETEHVGALHARGPHTTRQRWDHGVQRHVPPAVAALLFDLHRSKIHSCRTLSAPRSYARSSASQQRYSALSGRCLGALPCALPCACCRIPLYGIKA